MADSDVCKSCGKEVATSARKCPHCGQPAPAKSRSTTNKKILTGAAIAFVLIGLIAGLGSSGTSKSTEAVFNSGVDGSVAQVDSWFRTNLNDYDSLKVQSWSKVAKAGDNFMVRVRFRSKNALGGYVLADKIFTLDKNGAVIGMADAGAESQIDIKPGPP